jgi:hypothetical protein
VTLVKKNTTSIPTNVTSHVQPVLITLKLHSNNVRSVTRDVKLVLMKLITNVHFVMMDISGSTILV